MAGRKVVVYYAWSRPGESGAARGDRESVSDALRKSPDGLSEVRGTVRSISVRQSVAGFLDHIMKRNFTSFVELAETLTGQPVTQIERRRGRRQARGESSGHSRESRHAHRHQL